jgi:hypothetical protein
VPSVFAQEVVIAVACADFSVRVLLLPLVPPSRGQKGNRLQPLGDVIAEIRHTGIPTSVSFTWTSQGAAEDDATVDEAELDTEMDDAQRERESSLGIREHQETDLLIASTSGDALGSLFITRVELRDDGVSTTFVKGSRTPFQKIALPSAPLSVAFNPATYPSKLHSQLLVSHSDGTVRIYDPLASRSGSLGEPNGKPGNLSRGSWLRSFSTAFTALKSADENAAGLARRKRILDAKWVSNGRAIMALLIDGEWGVWDVSGASPAGSTLPLHGSFALWGVVGAGVSTTSSVPLHAAKKPRGSRSSLAPMTPNTRRSKEESLFVGQSISPTTAARGGIYISTSPLLSAASTEDSVVLWYRDSICSIDSLQSFWSRIAKESSSGSSRLSGGSLFGPGLTKIDGVELGNQTIKSICLVSTEASSSGSKKQEILVATEHQLIFLSHTTQRSAEQINALFAGETQQDSSDQVAFQQLLARGAVGLGGLDSMLDRLDRRDDVFRTGALSLPASRKVGFAS